jgi:TPR repeat protein
VVLHYGKAAEPKHAGAHNNLGVMCSNGRGAVQDAATAVWVWFRKAAEQGFAEAQCNLRLTAKSVASAKPKPGGGAVVVVSYIRLR